MSRDAYAREVLRAGRDLRITPKGVVIGFATVFVECEWIMYANAKDPETLNFPHERVGSDSRSSGLFQQQPPWWGAVADRMDPYRSARLFFGALAKLDYTSSSRSPGAWAQAVQGSSFPDRYDQRIGEAQQLYDELTGGSTVPTFDYGITDTVFGYNPDTAGIGNSDGPRARTDYIAVHTQEGGNGDAIGLANFCNGAQVSYNIEVDDERTVLNAPVTDSSWSAAAANGIAFHLCFAGSYANWSGDKWLSRDSSDGLNEDAMLTRGAKAVAAACQQFGVPAEFAGDGGRNGWPVKPKGIVGHRDFGQRGGGHTDPGNGFPMDEFIRRVRSFMDNPQPQEAEMDFETFKAYMDAVASDVKDLRQQVTGGRDAGQYPGWPQLGNRTLVDAVSAVLANQVEIAKRLDAIEGKIR